MQIKVGETGSWFSPDDFEPFRQTEVSIEEAPNHSPSLTDRIGAASDRSRQTWKELKEVSFWSEVVPVREDLVRRLVNSQTFVAVGVLGLSPMLILSLEKTESQHTAFAIFFAAIWAVIFKSFVVPISGRWKPLVGAFLFTGLIGIPLLGCCQQLIPNLFGSPNASLGFMRRLPLQVLGVGIPEEICKALPVAFYLFKRRRESNPKLAILIAIFSGLGFAAFENVHYARQFVWIGNRVSGVTGTLLSAQMLRSVSLCFCHAIFAATSGYFLTTATISGQRIAALSIVGILTAGFLHGVYNSLASEQILFAAAWIAVSYILFHAYIEKLLVHVSSDDS